MATLISTDPLDARLDVDGDLYTGPEGTSFVYGIEGVAQLALIAVRMFKEEWFLNLDAGFPWYQEILAEKFNEGLTRTRLLESISDVPGVVEVLELSIVFEALTRTVDVTFKLRTEFGDTETLEA